MRFLFTHLMIAGAFILAIPTISSAEDTAKLNEVFNTHCVKSWMEKSEGVTDKVDYKNFGEKFCNCGSSQPLDTDADVSKAAQMCMSRTMLHDTMDYLEEKKGLDNLSEEKIESACLDKWNMVYPNINEKGKGQIKEYCQCAAPKLNDLNDDRDNVTDKEWNDKVNSIAATCASRVDPDAGKPTESKE